MRTNPHFGRSCLHDRNQLVPGSERGNTIRREAMLQHHAGAANRVTLDALHGTLSPLGRLVQTFAAGDVFRRVWDVSTEDADGLLTFFVLFQTVDTQVPVLRFELPVNATQSFGPLVDWSLVLNTTLFDELARLRRHGSVGVHHAHVFFEITPAPVVITVAEVAREAIFGEWAPVHRNAFEVACFALVWIRIVIPIGAKIVPWVKQQGVFQARVRRAAANVNVAAAREELIAGVAGAARIGFIFNVCEFIARHEEYCFAWVRMFSRREVVHKGVFAIFTCGRCDQFQIVTGFQSGIHALALLFLTL